MTLAEISLGTFSAFSGLRLVSYFPQIWRVARDGNGASAISYSTWLMWTGSHVSTGCYAAINLGDRLLAACSGLYAICCIVVIVITAIKRRRHTGLMSADAPPALWSSSLRPVANTPAKGT
ncbi:hypothetical protein JQ628_07825 [Bradyrhizobium lablabi]|uniref:hypothetical protein n=1 Tax=Bradyrhizobium lablabi TaxID=722472 RepID=UPI001BAA0F45|nr:hypothetical protein [Bradyrhizobium lablabi]MBR1121421.1 hypothetical protein [Bradyrhizobium lablabi]